MPTYDYQCTSCEHEFEAFQRMSEAPLSDCPACAQPALKRKIGLGAGFIFKGSGFYETDFKDRTGYKEEKKPSPDAKTDTGKTKDSPPAAPAAEKSATKDTSVSNAA